MINILEHLLEPIPTAILGVLCLITSVLGAVRIWMCYTGQLRCGLYWAEWVALIVFWFMFGLAFLHISVIAPDVLIVRSLLRALVAGTTLMLMTSHILAIYDRVRHDK